jgi:GxxExxY protein
MDSPSRKHEREFMGYEFDDMSGKVIAAAINVHRQLGPGFLETVYEQALKLELAKQGLAYESQKQVQVLYDGEVVGTHVLDLLVENQVVVELKAVKAFEDVHYAQLRSYLRATRMKVGLLLNFNSPRLLVKRVVN